MKKSDLIALINTIEGDADVNETVLAHEEFKPKQIETIDDFHKLLTENKTVQGFVDSNATKAIEGFKAKGMQSIIDVKIADAIKEAKGEPETPEQKQLRELKSEMENIKAEKLKAELNSKFKDVLTEKKIPTKMVDFLLNSTDEDVVNANITMFEQSMNSFIDSKVTERLGDSSYTPGADSGGKKTFTQEELAGMTADEINANWDAISAQ